MYVTGGRETQQGPPAKGRCLLLLLFLLLLLLLLLLLWLLPL